MTRTVYLVQRNNIDGLYLFEDEDQAVAYADLHPDAHFGIVDLLDPAAGASFIEAALEEEA